MCLHAVTLEMQVMEKEDGQQQIQQSWADSKQGNSKVIINDTTELTCLTSHILSEKPAQ